MIAALLLTACNGRPATVLNGQAVNSTNNSGVNGGLSAEETTDASGDTLASSENSSSNSEDNGAAVTESSSTKSENTVTTSDEKTTEQKDDKSDNATAGKTNAGEYSDPGNSSSSKTQDVAISDERISTTVSTDYFTIDVPATWSGDYDYKIITKEDGGYEIKFYEHADHQEIGGGLVFTIALYTEGSDYSFYPNYENIGKISTPKGNFDMIAVYPSDVQWTEANQKVYEEMREEAKDVISSVTPAANCELSLVSHSEKKAESYTSSESKGLETTVIHTENYTVTVPDNWSGLYDYSLVDRADGGYEVKFYEHADRVKNGSGFLFSLVLLKEGSDYSILPRSTTVGNISTKYGEYVLVAVYPTDVQWSEENKDVYAALAAGIPSVIASVHPAQVIDLEINPTLDDEVETVEISELENSENSSIATTAASSDSVTIVESIVNPEASTVVEQP